MELEASTDIECPFCGETSTISVDLSAGDNEYLEDCQVCCRPILITLEVENLEEGIFNVSTTSGS